MAILEKISSPRELDSLTRAEINLLCGEIREEIIHTAARNGGHLASNLGLVEATVALYRVFSCPHDQFIFDVGHQAYTHKLLTGRADRFSTIRQAGGISGFTNREESIYDTTTVGHAGSSLSSAVGLAEANRLLGRDNWVVCVIGDGALTNGMIYEALEQLAEKKLRLLILLNDNEMSISKNVGGVSAYLSLIRTSEKYFNFKHRLKRIFGKIPLIGRWMVRTAGSIKNFVKRTLGAETFFESLGLEYIGPADGNQVHKMISVLEEAKLAEGPVIVHIKTKKGKGYAPAEEHPEHFHSTSPFSVDPETDKKPRTETFTDRVSELLTKKAAENKSIVAITAAMTEGCGLSKFSQLYPERFYDVGIAEEHAVTMAGGLAMGGALPVVVMYSTFSQRVFDQLWQDIALQCGASRRAHTVLMLSHAGIVPGDGITHQGIFDVSLISPIGGVRIYSPHDFATLQSSFNQAVSDSGLSVVRYPKAAEAHCGVELSLRGLWRSVQFGEGESEKMLVTYGRVTKNVIDAARAYSERHNTAVTVATLTRIVPLPEDGELYELLNRHPEVLFVEEGVRRGGVGEMLATDSRVSTKVRIRAIENSVIPCGDVQYLMKLCGLDAESIEADI